VAADLEQEYYGFLSGVWQEFSHEAAGSHKSQQELCSIYNAVALASDEFLRNTLTRLEEEKD
jgi:hypothetical protein